MKLAKMNERKFTERLNAASQKENELSIQRTRSEYTKSKTRIAALDRIISKIYEDNIEDKISNERFQTMLGGYGSEQYEPKAKVADLETCPGASTASTKRQRPVFPQGESILGTLYETIFSYDKDSRPTGVYFGTYSKNLSFDTLGLNQLVTSKFRNGTTDLYTSTITTSRMTGPPRPNPIGWRQW